MYIEWPEGIVELEFITKEEKERTCVQFRRYIYRNIDAALRWQRDFTKYLMDECVFVQCHSNPCILYKYEDGELKIVMSIHVDDSLCAGTRKSLQKLYAKVRKKYKI